MKKNFFPSFPPLRSAVERVVDLFCPPLCVVCGSYPGWAQDSDSGNQADAEHILLCERCRQAIVEEDNLQCGRCAGPLACPCSETAECVNCRNENFHFDSAAALGEYPPPLSLQILAMKREQSGVLANTFARLFFRERRRRLEAFGADLVVPVPMHPLRFFLRGVNSAEQIARVLALQMGIPCRTDMIRRCRWTVRQAVLSGNLRRSNLVGAFKIVSRHRRMIDGKKILLVDDVMTTGSTCSEAARVLREAGASSVHAAVLARAGLVSGIPIPKGADKNTAE